MNISDEARDFIRRKGGAITLKSPYLEKDGCCKTTLVPATARLGQPPRSGGYQLAEQDGVTVYLPEELAAEAGGIGIGLRRRVFGLRELVVHGVRIPPDIAAHLELERTLGPSLARMIKGK